MRNCWQGTPEIAQARQRELGHISKKGWRSQMERFGVSCSLPGAQLREALCKGHKHCTWQGHVGRVGAPT